MAKVRTIGFQLRLQPDLHQKLKEASEEKQKSLNRLIVGLIEDHFASGEQASLSKRVSRLERSLLSERQRKADMVYTRTFTSLVGGKIGGK